MLGIRELEIGKPMLDSIGQKFNKGCDKKKTKKFNKGREDNLKHKTQYLK